jgi:hypothetical protein
MENRDLYGIITAFFAVGWCIERTASLNPIRNHVTTDIFAFLFKVGNVEFYCGPHDVGAPDGLKGGPWFRGSHYRFEDRRRRTDYLADSTA